MKAIGALLILVLITTGARAQLTSKDLAAAGVFPPPHATLAPSLMLRTVDGSLRTIGESLNGHPGFVVFVDYTCNSLCGTELQLLAGTIERARLGASEFRLLVIGIDPKDSPQSAAAMERAQIPAALRPFTTFFLPDPATLKTMTAALGYRYVYDASIDQFAHPSVIYMVAANGAMRAALTPLAVMSEDLRAILASTESPRPAWIRRLHLLCYAYDPATGRYSPRIDLLLKLGAAATLILLASRILRMRRPRRRRHRR